MMNARDIKPLGITVVLIAAVCGFLLWLPAGDNVASLPETPTSPCAGREEIVKSKIANLRAGPGTQNAIAGRVEKSTPVRICEERDGWKRLEVPGTSTAGWIRGDLTAAAPAEHGGQREPAGDALCAEINPAVVDLIVHRREPETHSVFIDPDLWSQLTFDKKKAVIFYFSRCEKLRKLRDAYTGEELGSEGWGGFHVR